ncbi:helix-turn-helix domain-containing protein [Enterococcus asini]|uniref:helix-turn-helix domain-containing protein n=1 Tax=Enterococcus asini TaxID=57732 RepID=UPI0022E132A0|nr:helix-turn-helix domain-containing protein [Enterococcus asini]
MNNFADRLREALSMKGISQAELSRRTGIGRNSISDYLKAKYEAKQDNLLLLANALDVNEAWLMGLDVDMEKTTITSIYDQLNPDRQKRVTEFAIRELNEQKGLASFPNSDFDATHTLAAHRVDEDHISSPEEIDDLKSFLDDLIEKDKKKHKD